MQHREAKEATETKTQGKKETETDTELKLTDCLK